MGRRNLHRIKDETIFSLSMYEDLDVTELAYMFGMSEIAIYKALARQKKKLLDK